jgi:Ricin-type beta-trefoil lectin domain-like
MAFGRKAEGGTPRIAADDDGWMAGDALFPRRPPIMSHRAPRGRWRHARPAAAVLVLVALGFAGHALIGPIRPRPGQAQDKPFPPTGGTTVSQLPTAADGSDPSPSRQLVASSGPPVTASPGSAAVPTHPRTAAPDPSTAVPPPTRPTQTAGPPSPIASPITAGPPAPTVVAPADGLTVFVVSQASSEHFGVAQEATSDGALIVQSTRTDSAQQWRLVAAGGGCYQLVNAHSGMALDDPNGSRANGTQMQQWTIGAGNPNQTWCFHSIGGGAYSISNLASGSLLDLRDGVLGDGVAVQEWGADPAAPNANQTWLLFRTG